MDIIECKLCSNNLNNTINHDNCKYDYFDKLKNVFQTEIYGIQSKLNEKVEECKQLQRLNDKLEKENDVLKLNIKKLENDQLHDRKSYELAPDTPPTQNAILNRAMLVDDGSNDESYKENKLNKTQRKVDEFSSPDEKKSNFLDIPRRKKIPFSMTTPNSAEKKKHHEVKWNSRKPLKKSNIGFSFIQPMHKMNGSDTGDSQAKSKSDLSKISLNKKLKQTRINFNKATGNLNTSILNRLGSNDETYCDDIIMPTPQNVIFNRTVRSSALSSKSTSVSPENKIFDFQLTPKEEPIKKPKLSIEKDIAPINSNDSVEFLPVDDEIIFVSDNTNVNFESDDSTNSNDLLEKYSIELGKEEIKGEIDTKTVKPNVLPNKKLPNKYNEYQITSPIRKKSEKAKRPGFDCPDCEKYYQLIGISMSDTEIQNRMNECSKHRKNQRLHLTPEGFWNPVFTPTQT